MRESAGRVGGADAPLLALLLGSQVQWIPLREDVRYPVPYRRKYLLGEETDTCLRHIARHAAKAEVAQQSARIDALASFGDRLLHLLRRAAGLPADEVPDHLVRISSDGRRVLLI